MTGMTAVFCAAGLACAGTRGVLAALGIASAVGGVFFLRAGVFILSFLPGQKIFPEQAPEVHALLKKICGRAGIPVPGLFIIASAGAYALAVGAGRRAHVALSQGLFEILGRGEFEGLLAHEAAHLKGGSAMARSLAAVVLLAFDKMLALVRGTVASASGDCGDPGRHPFVFLAAVLLMPFRFLVLWVLAPEAGVREADTTSRAWAGHPHALASALKKMEARNRRYPSASVEQLGPLLPLAPRGEGGRFTPPRAHPAIEGRLARLVRTPDSHFSS